MDDLSLVNPHLERAILAHIDAGVQQYDLILLFPEYTIEAQDELNRLSKIEKENHVILGDAIMDDALYEFLDSECPQYEDEAKHVSHHAYILHMHCILTLNRQLLHI